MRIFTHWTQIKRSLIIGRETCEVHGYGGSNFSESDARQDAEKRLHYVEAKIQGTAAAEENYEADIREEPLVRLNERNIVTRNKYGAEVLNSTSIVFVDIDHAPFRIFDLFTNRRDIALRKKRILAHVEKVAARHFSNTIAARVYETHSGVRLILTGIAPSPRSAELSRLMRRLHCDFLYLRLCEKQNCFRARLTPKPHRIQMRGLRLEYPMNPAVKQALEIWLPEYEERSAGYSTCHFLKSLGAEIPDEMISYHDKRTGAFESKPLA